MPPVITKVSVSSQGEEAIVCQVNANSDSSVNTGCWLGKGSYETVPVNLPLSGWIEPQTMVKVQTPSGISNIAYKSDGPNYVIQQSGSTPKTLITLPMEGHSNFNVKLEIGPDGSLSMSSD